MKSKQKKQVTWQQGLVLAVLVIATYVLVPQLGQFHDSFTVIKGANVSLLCLAFISILSAALVAALSYSQLSFKKIPFYRIALIQYAGMFINRLLPAGIGGVSLFIDFLYRQGHTLPKASTIAAINNALGFAGHLTLLLIAGLITSSNLIPEFTLENIRLYVLTISIVGLALWVLFHGMKRTNRVVVFWRNVIKTLKQFRSRKLALLRAYLYCIFNTLLHVLALTLVIRAFGVDLSLGASLVILTGGVAAATVTPTPGGVIGAEAALTAMLMTYNVEGSTALAIALSYRFVSYWLPILPGIAAFLYAQKQKFI